MGINIPAGVISTTQLVYTGCGGLGRNGGTNGDLHVHFTLTGDHHRTLVGRDIHSIEPVDLYVVLLGGQLIVKTLDGPVKLKIKPRTPNGAKFRLAGKGYPGFEGRGSRGDLLVILQVVLPCVLDATERRLFSTLRFRQKAKQELKNEQYSNIKNKVYA